MKLLTWTAIAALTAGVATALVAGLTWPTYDAALAFHEAANAAEFAGAETPNSLDFVSAPADLYLGHTIALIIAGVLVAVGILAALLTLHARATTTRANPGAAHA